MTTAKAQAVEIRWLRNLALTTIVGGLVTMPLLSKGDLSVTPTTIIFLVGACLLGCYLAVRCQGSVALEATLSRSLPILLPVFVLAIRALAT